MSYCFAVGIPLFWLFLSFKNRMHNLCIGLYRNLSWGCTVCKHTNKFIKYLAYFK